MNLPIGMQNYCRACPNRRTRRRFIHLQREGRAIQIHDSVDLRVGPNHPYFWYFRQSYNRYRKHCTQQDSPSATVEITNA